MGRVYERPRSPFWWLDYWQNGKRIRESSETTSRKQAEKMLKEREGRVAIGQPVDVRRNRLTFDEAIADVMADYRANGRKTLRDLELRTRLHLAPFFGGRRLVHIDDAHVRQYIVQRQGEGAKNATINRELEHLRTAYILSKMPSRPTFPKLKESDPRSNFVDVADFRAILAALVERGHAEVADIAEFGYLTLLRRGNATNAAWQWFTLDVRDGEVQGGVMRVPGDVTKNGQAVQQMVKGPLLDLVRRRWALRVPSCPLLFHRDGERIRDFRDAWQGATAAVGLPNVLFHDLRRSGARNYRKAGVPESVVQDLGGWRTRSMFLRYAIVDESDLAAAADALGAFMENAPGTRKVEPLRRKAQ